jgi:hypothetical protein
MKSNMDWAEIDYMLKFGYPTGYLRVGKNILPIPVSFWVGCG